MKQHLRGFDLKRFGLGDAGSLRMAQQCLSLSRQAWSKHGGAKRADVATRKIVSHKRKFVVAPIPKVGTKTLKKMLQTLQGSDIPQEDGSQSQIDISFVYAPLHRCIASLDDKYEVFSLVRNPWSRVLSCYKNKIISSRLGDIAIRSRYPALDASMSFESFVQWLDTDDGRDDIADRHWISQKRLLADPESGALLCNHIGRFETFTDDITAFLERVGLGHLTIPHINKTAISSDPKDYRSAYTETSREVVARRYRADIEAFGYDF